MLLGGNVRRRQMVCVQQNRPKLTRNGPRILLLVLLTDISQVPENKKLGVSFRYLKTLLTSPGNVEVNCPAKSRIIFLSFYLSNCASCSSKTVEQKTVRQPSCLSSYCTTKYLHSEITIVKIL